MVPSGDPRVPATFANIQKLKRHLNYDEKSINVAYINARSICKHNLEIREILTGGLVDILAVSESWLGPSSIPFSFSMNGYTLIRNDRLGRGGGVAFYLQKSLKAKIVLKSEPGSLIEFLFIELMLASGKILLGIIYNPPRTNNKVGLLEDVLYDITSGYERIALLGDFNINDLVYSAERERFRSLLDSLSLFPLSTGPTCHSPIASASSLVDYMILNGDFVSTCHGQLSVPSISEHDLLYFAFEARRKRTNLNHRFYYDYGNANDEMVLQEAFQLDWNSIYLHTSSDTKVQILNNNFDILREKCIPKRKIFFNDRGETWYNAALINLDQELTRAYNLWKRTRSAEDRRTFCTLRNKLNSKKRNHRYHFYRRKFQQTNGQGRGFHRNFKGLWRDGTSVEDSVPFSPDEINKHFTSISLPEVSIPLALDKNPDTNFSFRSVDEEELFMAIRSIKSRARGVDDIDLSMIKILLPIIFPFLLHIFNYILMSCDFPSAWKLAIIIPIKKKSTVSTLNDLRPIAIYPILSKILEHLMKFQIENHLSSQNLTSSSQSGFKRNHSTITALTIMTDDVRKSLDNNDLSISILLDYSKAFDMVNFTLLLQKLFLYFGFSSLACRLLYSYLSGRLQMVKLGELFSEILPILHGLGQGLVLGPKLFTLFTQDLEHRIRYSKSHFFVDDSNVNISGPLSSIKDTLDKLNTDLSSISNWSRENGLKLNENKSKSICFTRHRTAHHLFPAINGYLLPYESPVRSLGVLLDERITWEPHLNSICSKVYFLLRRLYQIKNILPQNIRLKVVRAYILPIIMYGEVLYFSAQKQFLSRLERALNACTRFVFNLRKYDRLGDHRNCILGRSLDSYLKIRVSIFLFKILHFKQPDYLYNNLRFTRSNRSHDLIIPRFNSSFYNNSLYVAGSRIWNSLPRHIRESGNVTTFRRLVYNHFTD